MDYQELKVALTSGNQVPGENFALLRDIARHVNSAVTTDEGRDLDIRAVAVGQWCTARWNERTTAPDMSSAAKPYRITPSTSFHCAKVAVSSRYFAGGSP